ncbi:shikimate dehydrogenase [Brucellaceae bacterium C25G]
MAETNQAFVTGYPIKHSRSPLIHGFWLREYGLQGSYRAIEVAPSDFSLFVETLGVKGLVGGNVTLPHKEEAFQLCAKLDEAAKAIGAVNTLWLEDNKVCGSNTDAYGFAANLDALAPDWDKAETALILGAGGASRAVIYALKERGFKTIFIVNRTLARAQELAEFFQSADVAITAHEWTDAETLVKAAGLIVNTTSLGMSGHAEDDEFPLDLSVAPSSALATDIVYVPLETVFLKKAKAAGLKTADGLGMLLHQAVPGFERWFGVRPQVSEALRAYILEDMAK